MCKEIRVSTLPKTWILDLEGTIVKHNGYKIDGYDTFLDGAEEFLHNIPEKDMVVFITSRQDDCIAQTEEFLKEHQIRYNHIIYNAPYGERILINDQKPSGLNMAISLSPARNQCCTEHFVEDPSL